MFGLRIDQAFKEFQAVYCWMEGKLSPKQVYLKYEEGNEKLSQTNTDDQIGRERQGLGGRCHV